MKRAIISIPLAAALFSCATGTSTKQDLSGGQPRAAAETTAGEAGEQAPQEQEAEADYVRLYRDAARDITLSLAGAPSGTVKGKQPGTPYTVRALRTDGSAAQGLAVTVQYPVSRENDDVTYGSALLVTADDGTASFTPPPPAQAMSAELRFFPALPEIAVDADSAQAELEGIAAEKTLSVPYKVRTDYLAKGGSIALVDYSSSGRPVTDNSMSSSALLAALMRKGYVGIGNADFTRQITGDRSGLYSAAKSLFGGASSFLIYGTVKYSQPPHKTDSGYAAGIMVEIACMDMRDGSTMYSATQEYTATSAQEQGLIGALRAKMAEDMAERLYYSM